MSECVRVCEWLFFKICVKYFDLSLLLLPPHVMSPGWLFINLAYIALAPDFNPVYELVFKTKMYSSQTRSLNSL